MGRADGVNGEADLRQPRKRRQAGFDRLAWWKKAEETLVSVMIPAIGRFSPTWPYNCPRSNKLMLDLCDFLQSEYKRAGSFEKSAHTHGSCTLALMASGEKKYQPLIRDLMDDYEKKRYDSTDVEGFPARGQVHDGIVMGEYYLMTKDSKLKPAMESLEDYLNDSVWPENGGLSHRPFEAITRRMAAGGPKGYGAMALPAELGMVALSLLKEAGLPHAAPSYQGIHEAFLCSVGENGAIGYAYENWDHAVFLLDDKNGAPKNSNRGIGYECLEGLKGICKYNVEWPTKADKRYKPTDWIDREAETNRVFDMGEPSAWSCVLWHRMSQNVPTITMETPAITSPAPAARLWRIKSAIQITARGDI